MSTATITPQQQQAISDLLATMELPVGLGTPEGACSIAAINLALTGELTDRIPDCMSMVIGRWIIRVQDAIPSQMRNSAEWKSLLPLAAGTGRDHEQERLQIILEWLWGTVLPSVQSIADHNGFGVEWRTMICDRTPEAVCAANATANATAIATATATAVCAAASTARVAARARAAARAAANAIAEAIAAEAIAAEAIAEAAFRASVCLSNANAADVARQALGLWSASAAAAADKAAASTWQQFNPCGLLRRLIEFSPPA